MVMDLPVRLTMGVDGSDMPIPGYCSYIKGLLWSLTGKLENLRYAVELRGNRAWGGGVDRM
jgi:hypothetical protein